MKGSLLTSVAVHVLLLALAMTTLSAPEKFDVADVEALPVDIVPISEITQIQQGDKTAPKAEKAAPVPTKNPKHVENAENMGENDVDLKTPPTPQTRPKEQEVAAAPTPTEKPAPIQDSKPTESKDIVKEDTAPPVPNVKPEPKPPEPKPPTPEPKPPEPKPPEAKPEPKPPEPKPPEPKADTKPAEPPQSETGEIPVPQNVPTPQVRPKPPETKVADAKPTDSKATDQASASKDAKADAKKQEAAKSASSKQSDFNADEVAALLNKTDAKGGGAKRSADKAAFGGKKTTGGSTLSQSEMDALRGQIQKNWSVISGIEGAEGVIIKVTMKLDQNGEIIGQPEVEASGGSDSARRTLQSSALRAVRRSAPFKGLPPDKYDAWSEVVVNFDPSELL